MKDALKEHLISVKTRGASSSHGLVMLRQSTAPRFMFGLVVGLSFGFALTMFFFSPVKHIQTLGMFKIMKNTPEISQLTEGSDQTPSSETTTVDCLLRNIDLNSSYVNELVRDIEEVTARQIARDVRVLCTVLTNNDNLESRAAHVRDTWTKHCNVILFISNQPKPEFPAINVTSDKSNKWKEVISTIKYVYNHHLGEFEWLLLTNDQTYVVVENLRDKVLSLQANESNFLCLHDRKPVKDTFTGDGSAIFLSNEAVKVLAIKGFDGKNKDCPSDDESGGFEVHLGQCLKAVGANQHDPKDDQGRKTSLAGNAGHARPDHVPDENWWHNNYIYWPEPQHSLNDTSDKPLTFHGVSAHKMYVLEYLIYHVDVYPLYHISTLPPTTTTVTTNATSTRAPTTIAKTVVNNLISQLKELNETVMEAKKQADKATK